MQRAIKGHRSESTRVEITLGKKTATLVVLQPNRRGTALGGWDKVSEVTVALEANATDAHTADIDQVFPQRDDDDAVCGLVGLRTKYISSLGDLDFCATLKVRVHGELDPVTFQGDYVEYLDESKSYWDAVIMPVRI